MEYDDLQISLGIPANKNQRNFIDSLNAALRTRMPSSQASAGFDEHGAFVTQLWGSCTLSTGAVNLYWKLRKAPDGTLEFVEVEAENDTDAGAWAQEVNQLVTEVLASVLGDRREKFFQRSFLYYIGPQLDGEYWLPGFRFGPVWPEDPQPHLLNAERVVTLDQEVPALDEMHARSVAAEVVSRNSARLSLLLNTGLYTPPAIECWVVSDREEGESLKSERRQRLYIDPGAVRSAMPEKQELCDMGSYSGDIRASYIVAGQLLSLPRESRKILRGIDNSAPEVAQAFDSGARLFHVGKVCGKSFPSVGIAYRVAAIEAMCQADRQHKGFSEFVRAHVEPRDGLDEILNRLYGEARSGHFHGGSFPAGEFSRQEFFDRFMDDEQVRRWELDRHSEEITREAMVNWIFDRVPDL